MLRSFAIVLAALALVGCEEELKKGEVYAMEVEPESTLVMPVQVYTGQTCYGTGTSQYCTSNYIWVTYVHHDDEDYVLRIKATKCNDEKGTCKEITGKVYVDRGTYERFTVGDFFDGSSTPAQYEDDYRRGRKA